MSQWLGNITFWASFDAKIKTFKALFCVMIYSKGFTGVTPLREDTDEHDDRDDCDDYEDHDDDMNLW